MGYTENELAQDLQNQEYKFGFTTNIESDQAPKGLNESIIRFISEKKEEPEWLLQFRLNAYKTWQTLTEPTWAHVHYEKPNFQNIIYYSAPKQKKKYESWDDVEPEMKETMKKLGISMEEQQRLTGTNIAVDFVMDSVSVATSFKEKLAELGIIFCSFSEAVKEHPELVKKYMGTVVPTTDNFYAALNSAVFTDGSFCYIPKGIKCPMELSTYFRINEGGTGQFERTLVIADQGAFVSRPVFSQSCCLVWRLCRRNRRCCYCRYCRLSFASFQSCICTHRWFLFSASCLHWPRPLACLC